MFTNSITSALFFEKQGLEPATSCLFSKSLFPVGLLFHIWCRWRESNSQAISGGKFWVYCVYQFHHTCIISGAKGGTRTHTSIKTRLLRPLRIPIPPLSRHSNFWYRWWGSNPHWMDFKSIASAGLGYTCMISGAEEETRTPTPFGTGILNRHVYHSITSAWFYNLVQVARVELATSRFWIWHLCQLGHTCIYLVRMVGLEPTRHTAGDFKSPVSTNSTTSAWF